MLALPLIREAQVIPIEDISDAALVVSVGRYNRDALAEIYRRHAEQRTYQLWVLGEADPVSAGVLGPDPDLSAFTVSAGLTGLAITEGDGRGRDLDAEHPGACW